VGIQDASYDTDYANIREKREKRERKEKEREKEKEIEMEKGQECYISAFDYIGTQVIVSRRPYDTPRQAILRAH
jgi:hypothetical protein